ncbi:MAG: SufE family protein [Chloroflexota bacterium]
MSDQTNALPPRLSEIVEDFKFSEGREKLELLLEFSDSMPPLPERLHGQRDAMEPVHECMSPVFIHAEMEGEGMIYYFDVPEEAPTVRGYASVLSQALHGLTPEQVLALPTTFFEDMGLQKVLSPQRLNGITALLAHVKRLAVREMSSN